MLNQSVNPEWPTPSPVGLSIGDIRWQIAAEWLEPSQWSQRTAYRKLPSFFRMVPWPRPLTGGPKCTIGPTLQRVLPPGEYDRRYQQDSYVMPDVIMSPAVSPFAKLFWPLLVLQRTVNPNSIKNVSPSYFNWNTNKKLLILWTLL